MDIKIAILCNGYGRVERGAERFTQEFYDHLKNDIDIEIFSIQDTKTKFRDDFKLPWRNGRAYLESYYFGKKWYDMYYKNKMYDVVINNAGFPCSYWLNKHRKMTGTPFVTRARGGGREETFSRYFKPNHMIFLSEYHRSRIDNGKIKTVVIPNAIDIKEFTKKRPKSKLVDGMDTPIFLSTSALVKFKRNELIIKAVAKLGKGSLVQTSKGNLQECTVKLGEDMLGDRFKYTGVISREEILRLYQSCNIFVSASKKEAFGVVYLEAMASGLPVVTQEDKRRAEIIGNAGCLVDCEYISLFTDALSDASKKDWGNEPLTQAKKYEWCNIKENYLDLLRMVVN